MATVLMMMAIVSYTPEVRLDTDIEGPVAEADTQMVYIEALDNRALKAIELSRFAFVRSTQTREAVNYEVYVKDPIDTWTYAEDLSKELEDIWAEYTTGRTVRVIVLNYDDLELIDFIAENGEATYNRRKEK